MPNRANTACTNEPEWSDFKILVALSRGGSIAGAARVLEVDHSTVSRRLAALEESVGARLIVRGGREFSWTAEGRTLLAAAEVVEATIGAATRTVRSSKLEAEGSVRMSCAPGLNASLARMLPEVREKHPLLVIELCAENRTVDLAKGEADIALRMFRPSEPGLICKQVMELGWCVYAAPAYVAAHGQPSSAADLAQHQLVTYVEVMQRAAGPRWLQEHRGAGASSIQVDNTEVAAQAIASGGGIGVIPALVACTRSDLVRVFDEPIAFSTGYLVYHETMRDTARVRVAIDALTELFRSKADEFYGRVA